ncbi:hypothetical protein Bca101_050567 [Brassica carinata]
MSTHTLQAQGRRSTVALPEKIKAHKECRPGAKRKDIAPYARGTKVIGKADRGARQHPGTSMFQKGLPQNIRVPREPVPRTPARSLSRISERGPSSKKHERRRLRGAIGITSLSASRTSPQEVIGDEKGSVKRRRGLEQPPTSEDGKTSSSGFIFLKISAGVGLRPIKRYREPLYTSRSSLLVEPEKETRMFPNIPENPWHKRPALKKETRSSQEKGKSSLKRKISQKDKKDMYLLKEELT